MFQQRSDPSLIHCVQDVPAQSFVTAYAAHLKKGGQFRLPEWHDVVKTGHLKEQAPTNADWMFVRAAGLLRRLSARPGKGVLHFRHLYGGKKNRGNKPEHHVLASGKVIRYIMQELERVGFVQQMPNGGRALTPVGQKSVTQVAKTLVQKEVETTE
ncbi:MAG: hypothetical protein KVP17_003711 [Porospora cf. gigantea B]|uniref:uncharacterized protein n=1 Tax=Porospora cf. gigantea B TaxID=2853592 RepID=UPI003571DC9B|nr:MAG: hypothetical protein KVP17_003711 [Porospora cf. gigantea B]